MGFEVLFLCARRSHTTLLCRRGGVRCFLEEEAARRAPVTVTTQRHCGGRTTTARTTSDDFHRGCDPWWKSSLMRAAAGHRWPLHHHLYWEGGGGGGGHHGGGLVRRSRVSTTRGLCTSQAPGGKQPKESREDSSSTTTTTTTPPPDAGQGLFKFKELYENPWTIPNLLCVCRIVLAPYLGHLIIEQHFHLSLVLFTLAGATDLLDGYIARTWPSQKSAMGSALDPLADKILISILYVSLTYAQLIPAPLTALVIFRDVGLIAAVFWVRYKTVPPPVTLSKFFNPCYATAQLKPTLFSKVNTAIQLLLVAASLASPVFHYTDSVLLQSLWYITAVTTAASGYSYWHYGRKTVEVLNAQKRPEQ